MINTELEKLYYEDKNERESNTIQSEKELTDNTKKRIETLKKMLPAVDTEEIWNCHYIAYLLHHGDSTEDYKLAHYYAKKAVEMGSSVTKWLYAATLDRLLISQGKPQKYGTQFKLIDSKKVYFPTDGTISEEEKIKHGVEYINE